ncbi:NlpC/P60 family protein [Corticibacterium sp. UT-5YL-CI-8]|nr:NlpC/P60 family protein [Tianweitania sp. UT-5YL-CI-8]
MNHWSAALVGLPYVPRGRTLEGFDCWGCVRLALASAGVSVPAYDGVDPEDTATKSRLFQQGAGTDAWRRVSAPAEFDVALFRMGRHDSHVGIVVSPTQMLHADRRAGQSVVESFDSVKWANRLVGFYRHMDIA